MMVGQELGIASSTEQKLGNFLRRGGGNVRDLLEALRGEVSVHGGVGGGGVDGIGGGGRHGWTVYR